MKSYLYLLFLTVACAFAMGYYALSLKQGSKASNEEILEIYSLLDKFFAETKPVAQADFQSLYYQNNQVQLIDPIITLPKENFEDDGLLFSSSKGCFTSLPHIFHKISSYPIHT